MTILTTTYNCENYIEKCLYSLMSQSFKEFKCFITDDLSTDNTVKKIKSIIEGDSRFVLVQNTTKLFQPGNYDNIIRNYIKDDQEICVEVDGDDWLVNSKVLEKINEIYTMEDVWCTSGSFRYSDGRPGFATPPTTFDNIRKQTFTLSHLRTWKAWLWKKIEQSDLIDNNGQYWEVAGDLSFMYPMVEMSGTNHFKFMRDILYIYNETNPLNDHKVNMEKVLKTVKIIRDKVPYEQL